MKIFLLQEGMAAGPYVLLGFIILLLIAGLGLYIFWRIVKNGEEIKNIKSQKEERHSELKEKRTVNFFLITLLLIIVLLLGKILNWAVSLKFD